MQQSIVIGFSTVEVENFTLLNAFYICQFLGKLKISKYEVDVTHHYVLEVLSWHI